MSDPRTPYFAALVILVLGSAVAFLLVTAWWLNSRPITSTLTLPATAPIGRVITVKTSWNHATLVLPPTGQTIDGVSAIEMQPLTIRNFRFDGLQWRLGLLR